MLNSYFIAMLEMTIVTSLGIILLHISESFLKKEYIVYWRYFVWLVLAIRLLIPISMKITYFPYILPAIDRSIFAKRELFLGSYKLELFLSILNISVFIWLAGFFIFVCYHFLTYIAFKRQIKRWKVPVTNSTVITVYDQLCTEFRIKKKPQIQICKKVNSPMIYGLIRSMLILPRETYEEWEIELVLRHELIHYKRGDIWFKLILLFTNAVHWFNPFVKLLVRSASRDIEIACDYEVLKSKDMECRERYGRTILAAMYKEKQYEPALSTYFKGDKNAIKERFEQIFDKSKKRKGILLLCVVLAGIIVSSFFISFESKVSDSYCGCNSEIIYPNRTASIRNTEKVETILSLLGSSYHIFDQSFEVNHTDRPYSVTLKYEMAPETRDFHMHPEGQKEFKENAAILFSTIGNLGVVNYQLSYGAEEETFLHLTREEINSYFVEDIGTFAKNETTFLEFAHKIWTVPFLDKNHPYKSMEEAIYDGLNAIDYTYSKYFNRDIKISGYIPLEIEEKGNIVKVYAIANSWDFSIINNFFAYSRTSSDLCVFILSKGEEEGYTLLEIKTEDLSDDRLETQKKMFPETLWDIVYSPEKQEEYDILISEQIKNKARKYLDSMGKQIEIKNAWDEIEREDLSHMVTSSQVKEEQGGLEYLILFPQWKGTQEGVVDGIRYIYEADQYETESGVEILTLKKMTEEGTIVDQFEIEPEDPSNN